MKIRYSIQRDFPFHPQFFFMLFWGKYIHMYVWRRKKRKENTTNYFRLATNRSRECDVACVERKYARFDLFVKTIKNSLISCKLYFFLSISPTSQILCSLCQLIWNNTLDNMLKRSRINNKVDICEFARIEIFVHVKLILPLEWAYKRRTGSKPFNGKYKLFRNKCVYECVCVLGACVGVVFIILFSSVITFPWHKKITFWMK